MRNILLVFILGMGGLLLVWTIITIPVYLLWNWLMPQLFGLPVVTFVQAWGLVILVGLLFKESVSTKTH